MKTCASMSFQTNGGGGVEMAIAQMELALI